MMKINVKRSDLLRFHSIFSNACPVALNKVYLIFCSNDFLLLAKVIASALSKSITLQIQYDDQAIIHPFYESNNVNKMILQDVLNIMDDSALLNDHGMISLTLSDSLSVLVLLENLLLAKNILLKTHLVKDSLTYQKLFSIGKKLGYTNYNKLFNNNNNNTFCSFNRGDILNVIDDSGAKTVQVEGLVEPFIYSVTILKVKFGNEHKFPYGKKYAAVLLRDLIVDCECVDKVCLFEYFNGITKPLFSSISYNGVVIQQTELDYKQIIDSCCFSQGN